MNDISKKRRIAILFGGRSAEHDVSVLSAANVMKALTPTKYDAVPVFITPEGHWLLSDFEDGVLTKPTSCPRLCFLPGGHGHASAFPAQGCAYELPKFDTLSPVLHGRHGEDGAVQGLTEVARVPLAGCGILGSANSLDKEIAKRLFNEVGVPTARSITIRHGNAPTFRELERTLGLPVFIKPVRQGYSVGITKVSTESDYEMALSEGFRHDDKLLAEEFILGREGETMLPYSRGSKSRDIEGLVEEMALGSWGFGATPTIPQCQTSCRL